MSRKKAAIGAVLLVWLLAWAGLVWPTLWVYRTEYWESPFPPHDRHVEVRVRVNRLTGEKQSLEGTTWGNFVW